MTERPAAVRDPVDRAALVALASLPGMGPRRLRVVLRGRSPAAALAAVREGRPPLQPPPGEPAPRLPREVLDEWRAAASTLDAVALLAAQTARGSQLLLPGDPTWPERLCDDPEPPLLLFCDGDPMATAERSVAIVGTRRCSREGFDTALRLGADLSEAGVTVVSGLASGIDAAAHRGAVQADGAAPLAVVATGLDVVYPAANRALWEQVVDRGAVVTEATLGTPPSRWRFPARNRIVAALADLVVVVESPERGGSLYTVDEADRRAIDVLAVPGSVRSPACAGTNALLHEGRGVARDADDVLMALGWVAPRPDRSDEPATTELAGVLEPGDVELLEAFEWAPVTIDHLVLRTGCAVEEVCLALARLCASGSVEEIDGWYVRHEARHLSGTDPIGRA